MEINFSDYASNLEPDVKARYFHKISKIGFDPYVGCDKVWKTSVKNIPKIDYIAIRDYLVFRKSFYSKQEFRAKKALASHDLTACGWVRKCRWIKVTIFHTVFICEVLHSMKLNDPALSPWVIYNERKFRVISAHCNCMAGQGEACSHIGALLFYIRVAGESNKERASVTGEFAYWMLPPAQKKKISPKKIQQLVLKKSIRGAALPCVEESSTSVPLKSELLPKKRVSSSQELSAFLKELKQTSVKSVIFDLAAPYNTENNVQVQSRPPSNTLDPIAFIKSKKDIELETTFALQKCEKNFYSKFVHIDVSVAINVYKSTTKQSDSFEWKKYRQIRITGSISYALYTYYCNINNKIRNWTNKLETIIFPRFCGSFATDYGKAKENTAIQILGRKYSTIISECGLVVNVAYPFLGFSPDGFFIDERGEYVLIEVKCPQLGRTMGGIDMCKNLDYIVMKNGKPTLKKRHEYYGQVQLGLFVCGLQRCILSIYSEKIADVEEVTVTYDEKFCKEFIVALQNVYFQYFLPYLVREIDRLMIISC